MLNQGLGGRELGRVVGEEGRGNGREGIRQSREENVGHRGMPFKA